MNTNDKPKSSQGSPKMQQIERYGVIALVFLLVTIVAVSFWGDSKSPGFWSRLTGKKDAKQDVATQTPADPSALVADHVADVNLPLSPAPAGTTPGATTPGLVDAAGLPNGNTANVVDMPIAGAGSLSAQPGQPIQPANGLVPGGTAPTTTAGLVPVTTPIVPAPAASSSEYVVKSGDSLALIARRQLGAESRWTEIAAANPGLDPKRLSPGMKLVMPSGAAPAATNAPSTSSTTKVASASKSTPKVTKPAADTKVAAAKNSSTYTVKKGDVLRSIAREKLGDEARWKEIVALNPGLDPKKLAVGQKIKLPGGESRRPVTVATVAAAGKPQVR